MAAQMVFIVSPLNHANPQVVSQRVEEAAKFGAWVIDVEGKNAFVAACHDAMIRKYQKVQNTLEWWRDNVEAFMAPASACYVLCLEGWEQSKGVALEVAVAKALGKPVIHYKVTETGYARL